MTRKAFTLTQDDNPLTVIDGVRRAHRRHSSDRDNLRVLIAKMRGSRIVTIEKRKYVEMPRMHLDLEYPLKPRQVLKGLLDTHLSALTSFNAVAYLQGSTGYSAYFQSTYPSKAGLSVDSRRRSSRILKLSLAQARADVLATDQSRRKLNNLLGYK